jgi:hypothetical protein
MRGVDVGLSRPQQDRQAFVELRTSDALAPGTFGARNLHLLTVPARLDRHWRFGATHSIRVKNNVDIILQFQRDIVSSNLPLYAYTSNAVLVGTQVRF